MQKGYWTAGVDIGSEITQVSYMTDGMTEPETLETLFATEENLSYLKDCLLAIPGLTVPADISSIDLVLSDFTLERAEEVERACIELGIEEDAIHLQGREEACIYFALNQERNLWNNDVVFFDFSRDGCVYRSLHVQRGSTSITAELTVEKLDEMNYEKPSDETFLRLAKERLDRRLISAVYLIGEGFFGEDWDKQSLPYLCNRRRVFKGLNLYTRAASYAAYDRIHARAFDQVQLLCKNRLRASVILPVKVKGERRLLYLAKAGMSWYEARALIEAIPDALSEIELVLRSLKGEEKTEIISLESFPKRERRMTRLEIRLAFINDRHGLIFVRDLGFVSMEKASDVCFRKDILIE